jgi:hypothetical protein
MAAMHALFDADQTALTCRRLAKHYPKILTQLDSAGQPQASAQAYLITGPCGVGARTTAYFTALRLLAGIEDWQNLVAAIEHPKVQSLTASLHSQVHPEFHALPAGTCTVDQVRTLRSKLALRRTQSGARVVVIEKANLLSAACLNGLLKTIEQPPPRTIFLITADRPVAVTLASRCQRLTMVPLPAEQLMGELETIAQAAACLENPLFLGLAQGRIGRSMHLINQLDWAMQAWKMLQASLSSYPTLDAHWAASFSQGDDDQDGQTGFDQLWYDVVTLFLNRLGRFVGARNKWHLFAKVDEIVQKSTRLFHDYTMLHTDILLTVQAVHATIYATWRTSDDPSFFHDADLLRQ